MVRALLERVLNACFARVTQKQYTRELLFSSVFELMRLVVFKAFPSVNAAYLAQQANIGVSITSVYNKLNGLETEVPAALVQETATEFGHLITQLNAPCQALLPGYRVKMLVIYDPGLEMAMDVLPCEDGHAQERALLDRIQNSVQAADVFVMDRNFCVRRHLFKIAGKGGVSSAGITSKCHTGR